MLNYSDRDFYCVLHIDPIGGGGMAAGNALLALAGPLGWIISGGALVVSGILFFRGQNEKDKLEKIYTCIAHRDTKSYNLAIVELKERITRINDETEKLKNAKSRIKSFGTDYNKMTEAEQYELGSYVNLQSSSTQLLVNPILGLQPKVTEEYFLTLKEQYRTGIKRYSSIKEVNTGIYTIMCKFKNPIIEIADLLFSVELSESETKLLTKSIKNNKKFRESLKLNKDDISSVVYAAKIVSKHRQEEE